jgi:hypothetical protein
MQGRAGERRSHAFVIHQRFRLCQPGSHRRVDAAALA